MGMGSIFNKPQRMFICQLTQGLQVGRQAMNMNGHDRFRLAGDGLLHLRRIQAIREGIDIHEYRDRFGSNDRLSRRDKREGRYNDLVSWLHANSDKS
ncbi:hypothetical protein D3C73_617790 [compost metagenome]